jgi:hypothetical protein
MQLTNVVEPFGEVNVYKQQGGRLNIVATALQQYKDQAFKICESLAKLWKDVYVHQLELKNTAIAIP